MAAQIQSYSSSQRHPFESLFETLFNKQVLKAALLYKFLNIPNPHSLEFYTYLGRCREDCI